jgi:hypothetical protein
MRISKNFTLSEITHSNTAKRLGIDNSPNKEHLENIKVLVNDLIQPMRSALGPIRISSGYRNPQLNHAIGGSSRSQHCKGQAFDVQFWKNGKMCNKEIYDWVIKSGIEFDQMINEFDFSWIHISLKKENNRNVILEAYKDKEGHTRYKVA